MGGLVCVESCYEFDDKDDGSMHWIFYFTVFFWPVLQYIHQIGVLCMHSSGRRKTQNKKTSFSVYLTEEPSHTQFILILCHFRGRKKDMSC